MKNKGTWTIVPLALGLIQLCQTSPVLAQYCKNATQAPEELSVCGDGALTEYVATRVSNDLLIDWAEEGLTELIPSLEWINCRADIDPDVSVTRVLTICQSALDSRDLFALVTTKVSCGTGNDAEPMESKWTLRINLITNEMNFENICAIK